MEDKLTGPFVANEGLVGKDLGNGRFLVLADARHPSVAKQIADMLNAAEKAEQWRDVLEWTDEGEKTIFEWSTGGGDKSGEFGEIGLIRELPDGSYVRRAYKAKGPWK